jgi:CubicO group peptidase (beta-lactamase class C family)
MRKWIIGLLLLMAAGAAAFWFTADKETRGLIATMPTNRDVLFWNDEERNAAFRAMDRIPILAKSNVIEAGGTVLPLPAGAPLIPPAELKRYLDDQRGASIVILHQGKIVEEQYGLGFDAKGRWTSFSVAKSLTSTLVGAAIRDGKIKSLEDKVTAYIPDLKGSAYDDVTVAQLLTMTSGVKWNEDYTDPKSDVALFTEHKAAPGVDSTVSYMRTLPREAPAGSKWLYKTGETNLIGVLVSQATGKPLSAYLSEKIWKPFGMEQQATWLLGSTGHEISGCCIQAATRDMARFGLFMLGGGRAGGKPVLPDGWIAAATTKQAETGKGEDGYDYGYQWWTLDNGAYAARGIFGQGIFIDPKRQLVIATNSNWPKATDPVRDAQRLAFYRRVQAAVDGGK